MKDFILSIDGTQIGESNGIFNFDDLKSGTIYEKYFRNVNEIKINKDSTFELSNKDMQIRILIIKWAKQPTFDPSLDITEIKFKIV